MSDNCRIHGFPSDHTTRDCPVTNDVDKAVRHALGWRAALVPADRAAEAARLAFDAALSEDTAEHRQRARWSAESEVSARYEDEAYRNSQAEQRAKQEIRRVREEAQRKIEAEHSNMRDVLTGFVQALVDAHLPHEAVAEAVERVVAETRGAPVMGRDVFALDMAEQLVGDPVDATE